MSNLSNVEKALNELTPNMDKLQAEMVKAEVKTWLWNRDRIKDIERLVNAGKVGGVELDPDTRGKLIRERHQLVTESTSLYSHITRAVKGIDVQEADEFDMFMKG